MPVAWRVKDFADGWVLCHTEAQAQREAKGCGNTIQPLYASLSRGEPEGWRDIVSAPKDGTRVLLWSSTSGGVWWGYWAVHGANWQPTDTGEDGWTSGAVNSSAELVVYIDPTHWMPLPKSPEDKG